MKKLIALSCFAALLLAGCGKTQQGSSSEGTAVTTEPVSTAAEMTTEKAETTTAAADTTAAGTEAGARIHCPRRRQYRIPRKRGRYNRLKGHVCCR